MSDYEIKINGCHLTGWKAAVVLAVWLGVLPVIGLAAIAGWLR